MTSASDYIDGFVLSKLHCGRPHKKSVAFTDMASVIRHVHDKHSGRIRSWGGRKVIVIRFSEDTHDHFIYDIEYEHDPRRINRHVDRRWEALVENQNYRGSTLTDIATVLLNQKDAQEALDKIDPPRSWTENGVVPGSIPASKASVPPDYAPYADLEVFDEMELDEPEEEQAADPKQDRHSHDAEEDEEDKHLESEDAGHDGGALNTGSVHSSQDDVDDYILSSFHCSCLDDESAHYPFPNISLLLQHIRQQHPTQIVTYAPYVTATPVDHFPIVMGGRKVITYKAAYIDNACKENRVVPEWMSALAAREGGVNTWEDASFPLDPDEGESHVKTLYHLPNPSDIGGQTSSAQHEDATDIEVTGLDSPQGRGDVNTMDADVDQENINNTATTGFTDQNQGEGRRGNAPTPENVHSHTSEDDPTGISIDDAPGKMKLRTKGATLQPGDKNNNRIAKGRDQMQGTAIDPSDPKNKDDFWAESILDEEEDAEGRLYYLISWEPNMIRATSVFSEETTGLKTVRFKGQDWSYKEHVQRCEKMTKETVRIHWKESLVARENVEGSLLEEWLREKDVNGYK